MTDVTEENETYEETPTERPNTFENIEEEGDIAADYLRNCWILSPILMVILILRCGVTSARTWLFLTTKITMKNSANWLAVMGKCLRPLQELVRLSVLAASGNRSRLILMWQGIVQNAVNSWLMARQAVEKVRESGETPYEPAGRLYERKIVHDIVAEQDSTVSLRGRACPNTLLFLAPRYVEHTLTGKTRLPLNKSLVTVCAAGTALRRASGYQWY